MNIDKLKAAVRIQQEEHDIHYSIPRDAGTSDFWEVGDSLKCLIDLAHYHIKAMESGLPSRRNGNGNHSKEQWKTCVCEACYDARTFNEAIDLILPHLVARDEKIKELQYSIANIFLDKNRLEQLEAEVKQLKDELESCKSLMTDGEKAWWGKIKDLEAEVKFYENETKWYREQLHLTPLENSIVKKIKFQNEAQVKRLKGC